MYIITTPLSYIYAQPLNGLDADCFRIVLAGKKEFTKEDCKRVIDLMQQYGDDL